MNFEEWLERNQYDIDFGNDTIDLMKIAYIEAFKQSIQVIIDCDMCGNEAAIKLNKLIEDSE